MEDKDKKFIYNEKDDTVTIIQVVDGEVLKRTLSVCTLLSEASLSKTWLNEKEDEAWKDL